MRQTNLVHLTNDGNEESCVEVPFANEALDQRDQLRAWTSVLGKDGQDTKGERLGARREASHESRTFRRLG